MKTLYTQRLFLRKVTVTDAPFFVEILNEPSWIQYIGDRNIKSVAAAETFIEEKYLASYKTNGFGSYLVLEKETNLPIGLCGLYQRADLDFPDIGFAFLEDYQGKGYGFESAHAVLIHALQDLNFKTVLGFTVSENKASIQLLQKLGLQQTGTYQPEGGDEVLLLFRLNQT